MKYLINFWLALFFLAASLPMSAQVPLPDLFCVSNQGDGRDTLRFDLPTVSCGTADSLLVFQSTDREGPFTLERVVTDLAATAIRLPNSSNETRYYFLRLVADCTDSLSLPSDTLSNLLPPLIPIHSVSVENGETIIRWTERSGDFSKIRNYIIYRVDVGTEAIDTVAAPLDSFVDPNSAANLQSEFYYVQALDGCGLAGSLGNQPHNTIFLRDSIDACGRRALLEWNAYEAWDSVAYYDLWVSENGGPFNKIDQLPPDQLEAQVPNLDSEINYSYYIQAEHPDTFFIARSNQLSRTPNITQGIRELNAWGADVSNNTVTLEWQWNDDAELVDAQILSLSDPLDNIDINDLIANIQTDNSIEINTPLTEEQPLSFAIQTIDACDSTFVSDTITTAYISARALPSFENEVQFSAPQVGRAVDIASCEILRFRNNQVETGIPVNPSQTEYSEAFDPFENPDDEICYQLRCNAMVEGLDSISREYTLTSNIACPSREVRLQIPNALRPSGENPEFRPLFLFENSITEYQMQIFDRWGQMVFETSEPLEAWRGRIEGQQAPPGTYVYRIYLEQRQGDPITKKGTVTLVR